MSRRIQVFKGILWTITGLAAAVTLVRFTRGLGATTVLSDVTPWGLWVGFDVMGGVALAAGGFVVAAIVHIFHRERYHPVARPAILSAMLGYAAVVVGLLYDLGLPWHLWSPIIHWNPRSPLFEVAWCVMLYLTVLILEFSPVFLERTRFQRTYRALLRLQLPIIIAGISLSTLHQSSLGTLMLIMPFRLHPLWYTPQLPELFFVSAICLGLAMVIFECSITAWLYERPTHPHVLSGLGRFAAWGLAFYLLFKLGDLAHQGKLGLIFEGSFESNLFIFEMMISVIVPMILFAIPAVRRSHTGVFIASSLCVMGLVLNRIDTSGLAQIAATGTRYFPSWTEWTVSLGIVAGFALIYFFIQERFPVEKDLLEEEERWRRLQLFVLPSFDRLSRGWLGNAAFASRRVYSLLFVVAFILGLTLTAWSPRVEATPVERARGNPLANTVSTGKTPGANDFLMLGFPQGTVRFPHADHIKRIGETKCGVCHHLNKPGDTATPCSECHRDMYLPTNIFHHVRHVELLDGNSSCDRCHPAGCGRSAATVKPCSTCHSRDMMAANEIVTEFKTVSAPGYRKAMHTLCIACHRREATNPTLKRPDLFRCATCHSNPQPSGREVLLASRKAQEKPAVTTP